ncbi:MAG TPA: hypothetical protein VGL02_18940 [Streptomyces sp.]
MGAAIWAVTALACTAWLVIVACAVHTLFQPVPADRRKETP